MKVFGKNDIASAVDVSNRLSKEKHNREVDENRKYLKYLIDAILYLAKQEMPLLSY